MNSNLSHQLGRSIVEMFGVLAIIGVLSIGGIAGYSKAMERHNLNKLKSQFFMIIQNITTAVTEGHVASELANNTNALNIIPQEMGKAGNCRHSLGGRCTVTGGGDGTIASVRFQDLPPKACIEMATLDLTAYGVRIYVNSTNNLSITSDTCRTEDGQQSCKSSKLRTLSEATQECSGKLNALVYAFTAKF